MTIQFCVEVCKGQKMDLALINKEKCYCETSRENLVLLHQHFCTDKSSSCPGNPLQNCGSEYTKAFSIYEVGGLQPSNIEEIGTINQNYQR